MLAAAVADVQAGEALNIAIVALGGVCAVGFAGWLLSAGRWRRPLADAVETGDGPSALQVCGALLVYLLVALAIGFACRPFVDPAELDQPGTQAWHVSLAADSLAKLVAVAVMLGILARHPSFAADGRAHPRPGRALVLGAVAGLIVTAICTVQLSMTTVLWEWLHPEHAPPTHPALAALADSAWGAWGRVQLVITAVVIAALAEEVFFRGLLLQSIWRYTRHAWLSVLLSGLAFGLIHLSQPQDVLPLCTMGVALGYVRLRTRSLAVCVVAHAVFNARTMAIALFFPEVLEAM